eukprot:6489055-Amphidinium_carterae.1
MYLGLAGFCGVPGFTALEPQLSGAIYVSSMNHPEQLLQQLPSSHIMRRHEQGHASAFLRRKTNK